jgi:hypothetical protein
MVYFAFNLKEQDLETKLVKITHDLRTLKDLHTDRTSINLTPMWQRGVAWTVQKQVLLIDSILRGMDMPKIYLWLRKNGTYDVVDGQQRLRAVWDFMDNIYKLNHSQPLQQIENSDIAGKSFSELSPGLKRRINSFKVSIAYIGKTETRDITLLFARLQLAEPLNQAELRNAILCPIRHEIDVTALNHDFFSNCRISSKRMKHQDYAAHAYALAAKGVQADLKAPDLRELYIKSTQTSPHDLMLHSAEVDEALTLLKGLNIAANQKITQKWIFCDLVYFLIKQVRNKSLVDITEMAKLYKAFDTRRSANTKNPEVLLEGKLEESDKDLYDYINAFKIEGGRKESIAIRAGIIERFFEDCLS